jgi:hypothetical protein
VGYKIVEAKLMLVTPQLSQEIEKLLPATQTQLAQILQQTKQVKPLVPNGQEIESILLSVGDISLLVKRAVNTVR